MWYLPWGLDPLPEAEVNYSENQKKAKQQLPADPPHIFQPRRLMDLQDVSPVEVKHINHQVGRRQGEAFWKKIFVATLL